MHALCARATEQVYTVIKMPHIDVDQTDISITKYVLLE